MLVKIFLKKKFRTFSCSLLFAAFFFASILASKNSYADLDYGVGRIRTCNANGAVEGLDFNPTSGGKDALFDMSNPVCLTVAITSYATTKVAVASMNNICKSGGNKWPRPAPTPWLDAVDIAKSTKKIPGNTACGAAVTAAVGSLGSSMTELGAIYGTAKAVFNHTRLCGANWIAPNPNKYSISTPLYKQAVNLAIEGYAAGDDAARAKLSLDANDKTYNEWYYGGVEVLDNPNEGDVCLDVTKPKVNGYYPIQKYYLKGTETGNYNCKKFDLEEGQNHPRTNQPLTATDAEEFRAAYNCCKKRSQEYICIEIFDDESKPTQQKFCKVNTKCGIGRVGLGGDLITVQAKALEDGRLICAETYSLCPYNFAIGGGSEFCDYYQDGKWSGGDKWSEGYWSMITKSQVEEGIEKRNCHLYSEIRNPDCTYNEKAGKCKNYCQYLTHCTKTSGSDFRYNSEIRSPYFAMACINFAGDSQNKTAYNGGFILGSQRHFSAPIAQCVKETLENVFYNRAGHSACANLNEQPSADGSCPSGAYVKLEGELRQKRGEKVRSVSFFTTMQETLQTIVKLILTLSIMLYGMNVLTGKNDVRQSKDILVYVVKIALVLYFATGNAWQGMFFDGVYGASSEFSRMVFKIQTNSNEAFRDGCQFGDLTDKNGITTAAAIGRDYPPGKGYLAMWDTLDCKLARYLGFGPEVSAANIASLILAGFLTGPIGIYFAISLMFFGFFFIAATIRALHIFLSSCVSIIIFVFVSPIVIPTLLFEKTKNIFSGWLTNLIGFCLQPMLLFAYIAIFITIFDKAVIGSATFTGDPPTRKVSCKKICMNSDGTIEPYIDGTPPACTSVGQEEIDPMNDSVACLMTVDSYGEFQGLQAIGIAIPVLTKILDNNDTRKQRVFTLLKAALIMYVLCKFMDEIPGITSSIIGSGELPAGPTTSAKGMLDTVRKAARTAQKRAMGATKKIGGAVGRAGGRGAGAVRQALSKGKSAGADSGGGTSAGDHTGSSSRGGVGDHVGSSGGSSDSVGSSGGGADSSGSSPKP